MILYAESSAVLSWLFGEVHGAEVAGELARCETVFSSSLTLIQCDRTLLRARRLKRISKSKETSLKRVLATAASRWAVLSMDDRIVERARQPFSFEPIRTLDAIHLASALVVRNAVPELEILSLDEQIRNAAARSGVLCRPSSTSS